MKNVKWLVLGAGPAGIAFANCLKDAGVNDFIVLEAKEEAGGLCRTKIVDGAPLDIGGGHFLDVRRPHVCDFIFRFMPKKEWVLYERDSRIALGNELIGHPLEANIWQLTPDMQVEYLKSIATAGSNLGKAVPEKFVDWIYWKLGGRIANDYMLPYNRKLFGDDLDILGTYWLEKLPNVSFEETLLSCLNRKPYGTQPGHAQFYYPREYGYGEVWLRMADAIRGHIEYHATVTSIDAVNRVITTISGKEYQAERVITTIPWKSFELIGLEQLSVNVDVEELRHTGVEVSYYSENQESEAQWIYVPNENISYHRILSRKTFCPGSRGYWTETNLTRAEGKNKEHVYRNEYAYPLNTLEKPNIMKNLLSAMKKKQIYGLGRWGEHEHYNSDVVVERAMHLAEILLKSEE